MNSGEKGEFLGAAPRGRGAACLFHSVARPSPNCTCNYHFPPGQAQVLLIPFQERSLSLRVSQNKEPSRALRSDTKVTLTCALDCLKKKVEKEEKKEAQDTKGKVRKFSCLPSKEAN